LHRVHGWLRPGAPGFAGGLLAVVLVPVAVVVSRGDGFPVSRVELSGGGAWLPSVSVGRVTLIDGPSEQVVGSVLAPGARPGDGLSVVQSGSSAYIVNAVRGTVARVDGGLYEVTSSYRFGEGAGGTELNLFAGGGALYVVDGRRRVASVTDPVSLRVRERLSFAAQPGPGQSVVDAAGRLWVVDGVEGGLTWFDGGRQARSAVGDAGARLVLVQGRPVLVDQSRARLGALSGAGQVGSWSCLEVRAGDRVQLLGSASAPRVFAAVSASGMLLASAVDRDDCRWTVEVGRPGDEFGPLVEVGNYVFVPNRSTGRVAVVDVAAGAVVDTLEVLTQGSGLELIAKDGFVFYNDRSGDRAGVIRFDGNRWRPGKSLRKYNPAKKDEGLLTPGSDKAAPPKDSADTAADKPATPGPETGQATTPPVGPPDLTNPLPDPGTTPDPGDPAPPAPSPPPLPEREFLLTVQVTGGGSVTAADPPGAVCGAEDTCAWRYRDGTRVRLEMPLANPPGWRFDQVTGCDDTGTSGSARTCTLTVGRVRTVHAVWVPDTRSLTVAIAGNGTGTVSGQGLSCSGRRCTGSFPAGARVTLSADPGNRSTFDGWSGCSPAGSRTCSVTMDDDADVSVTFTRQPDTTPPDIRLSGGGETATPSSGASVQLSGGNTRVTLTATGTDDESEVTRTEIVLVHVQYVCKNAAGETKERIDAPGTVAESNSGTARHTVDVDRCRDREPDFPILVVATQQLRARASSEGGNSPQTENFSVNYSAT
jgi:Divergent InlB B-repeat domain